MLPLLGLVGVLIVGLVRLVVPSPVLAQDPPRAVRVGVYDNPPKIYLDEQGKASGVFADILSVIALKENWQLEFVPGTFQEGLERVRTGKIDLMVDVAVNDERLKTYDLTKETVLSSWGQVYVHSRSDIDSIQDLDGKSVAILKSSVYLEGTGGVKEFAGAFHLHINYVELSEYDEVFKQLAEKKVDAAVVSRISGLTAEAKYEDIKPTTIIFKPTELRFALTKGDPDSAYLIEKLDFWVEKLRDGYGGVYQTILEKNNLLGLTSEVKVTPAWVLPLILIAYAAVAISWVITIIILFLYRRARMSESRSTRGSKSR